MEPTEISPTRRFVSMTALILAGEAIFIPPFHPGRYFRTTLLEAFEITERQLGDALAWYGIAAMVCYALGGPLADRFAPRVLMAGSLIATGCGSLYMATVPGLLGLKLLFGFWGASTILAFWSPMIRATREWGGGMNQGRAFGILEGGRGLVATVVAVGAAWAVGGLLSAEVNDSAGALRALMVAYAMITFAVAAIVLVALPVSGRRPPTNERARAVTEIWGLLAHPAVWLQAVVVLTAYCAFKTFDFYGHYSEDVYGLSKNQSANLTAWLTFLRIVAAVGAGFLADRWLGASRAVFLCFGMLALVFGILYLAPPRSSFLGLAIANMAVAWTASCALRGIYFALLEESNVPRPLTGTAVGIVSFVGFTPDFFWPRFAGGLITSAREGGKVLAGYQQLWLVLAVISLVGLAAAALLRRLRPKD